MSLGDLVRFVSQNYPQQTAIIFNNRTWSYAEFNEITDRLAAALINLGIKKGDRIALHLSNSPELVFCYYACFKIGAIAVPINTRLKAKEIEYILNHTRAKICISQPDLFAEIQPITDSVPSVAHYYLVNHLSSSMTPLGANAEVSFFPNVGLFEDLLQPTENNLNFPIINHHDIAAILYTSGTTASPKGVTHTHHSLERTAVYHAHQVGLSNADICGVMLPMGHIFGFSLQVVAALRVGASLVIIPRFEPALVLENISKHQVTKLCGLPVMYNALVNYPDIATYQLTSLQVCFAGGDAVPATLQKRFEEITGVKILEGCGMTEVIPYTMNPPNGEKRVGSIGKPAIGMTLLLVDEKGRDVPPGKVGEIVVKSDAMMIGYWENPEASNAVLHEGWLHTGDLAWMDAEGYYWFVSRKKEMIVRGGSNISPLEVEAVLYQHPAIKEAGVIGVPDATWGEVVQAFISLQEGYTISKIELLEFIQQRIAAYKVPESIAFLPELPKGLTGKIHRKTLKDWATASVRILI
jgi:acyl-CoA synthetase (AMP-forming)/AMP-acid ligase II